MMMIIDTAVEGGAQGRIEQRRVRAFNNRNFDPSKFLPTVMFSNEDYGRITRVLADGTPVELEFNIVNRIYPEGKTSYNAIAEIAGSDKKDEVIMLGGHLDSWHSATGATDNAVGCAAMMEAAPNPEGHRRQTAPHDPRRPVERRRAGPSRFAGLRQRTFRVI